ncbi:hypothetical protein GCM10010123_28350 [Pilimelia anulata]|uniref:Malonyl-CoA:ACP transacylase (MAT) domain-containing protein n=1 Tax=Pilimelia anulata TaxID=53371 RepID=A0A8J3B8C2_9ACTN|nr:acyltransferase domain-containing protein [Pilimelia anulata]GGJ96680.1 hypothetical protein GCM10010123_28350 [Pilimelia anulata]
MSEPTIDPDRVALLLPGQGAQYPRMAAGLYGHDPAFSRAMDEAFDHLGDAAAGLRAEWLAARPSPAYDDVTVAQPLLYAVDHALGRAVLARGARPAALLGHSVGELAAATLAGVLDLADGMRVMRARMRQFADTPPGGMLAVAAAVAEVADLLGADVHLAAVNAARQLLLAGTDPALDRVAAACAARGLTHRRARARQAFHSPLVAAAVTASLPDWERVRLRPPALPVYSGYTGAPLTAAEATDPGFWARQAERTVRFDAALRTVLAAYDGVFVEAGPGGSLSALARRAGRPALPLLPDGPRGDAADRATFATTLARLRPPTPPTPARPGAAVRTPARPVAEPPPGPAAPPARPAAPAAGR